MKTPEVKWDNHPIPGNLCLNFCKDDGAIKDASKGKNV